MQRAPGGIVIQAKSDGHEFNWATMDVSHTVNHVSFGPFLSDTAWKVMPAHIAQAVGSLDDRCGSKPSLRHYQNSALLLPVLLPPLICQPSRAGSSLASSTSPPPTST